MREHDLATELDGVRAERLNDLVLGSPRMIAGTSKSGSACMPIKTPGALMRSASANVSSSQAFAAVRRSWNSATRSGRGFCTESVGSMPVQGFRLLLLPTT
jgi:hypothetical protein